MVRFGHVAIRIKKVEEMLDFYCKGLGFEDTFRINNDDGSLRIVYIHISNGQYLELCLGGETRPEFDDLKSIGTRHICFTVENIENSKKEMEERGVKFDSSILDTRDHNKNLWLFDPDGNKIEIVQIQPGSPQKKFEQVNKL